MQAFKLRHEETIPREILYFTVGDIISSPRLNYFAQSYPPDTFVTCKSYPPDTFRADTSFRYTGLTCSNSRKVDLLPVSLNQTGKHQHLQDSRDILRHISFSLHTTANVLFLTVLLSLVNYYMSLKLPFTAR